MILLRAILAFIALPGIFAGIIPALIISNDPWRGTSNLLGIAIIVCGLAILIACVRDFMVTGRGTLAPWDPPQRLVIVGLYRYSRNPMYVGIIFIISGWAVSANSPLLAIYGVFLACAFYARVVFGEEVILAQQFGKQWTEYSKTVARWFPRLLR